MSYTTKYYILAIGTSPLLVTLMMTSKLPLLVAFPIGAMSMVSLITGGYYLGKREHGR